MTKKILKPRRGNALTQDIEGKGTVIVTKPTFRSYHDRTPVLVVPLNDESITAMLLKAKTTIKRRLANRREGLSAIDNALIVMHSLGILKRIQLR